MPIVVSIIQVFLLSFLAGLFLKILGQEKPKSNLHTLFILSAKLVGSLLLLMAASRLLIFVFELWSLLTT